MTRTAEKTRYLRKKGLFRSCGISILLILSACGSASRPITPTTPEHERSSLEISDHPVLPAVLVDHLGNKVRVESIERIVPLDGSVAEIVFALGLGANIVATDLSATWPPEAADLPQIGYQRALSPEPIAAFSPTVLIGTDIAGPPQTLKDLRELGYPVVIVPNEPHSGGPSKKIRAVARALGVEERGDLLASDLDEQITAATKNPIPELRPLVAAIYVRGEGTQLVLGRNSSINWVIRAAGGQSLADILEIDDYTPITAEPLLVANPDAIIIPAAGLESVGGIPGLLEIGGLAETTAGRNQSVYSYEDQLLLGNGPRTGLLLKSLTSELEKLAEGS